MSAPIPGFHDINVNISDSCNCGCLPCSRRPKSPCKTQSTDDKIEVVAKKTWFKRLFSNDKTEITDPS